MILTRLFLVFHPSTAFSLSGSTAVRAATRVNAECCNVAVFSNVVSVAFTFRLSISPPSPPSPLSSSSSSTFSSSTPPLVLSSAAPRRRRAQRRCCSYNAVSRASGTRSGCSSSPSPLPLLLPPPPSCPRLLCLVSPFSSFPRPLADADASNAPHRKGRKNWRLVTPQIPSK